MARPTTDLSRADARPEGDGAADARRAPNPAFLWRSARVLALAAAVALGAMLLVYAAEVFLLAFAGVLVAVLLRAPSDWLSGRTGLSPGWSLALVTLAILAVLAGVGWLTVPSLISQAGQFGGQLSQAIRTVEQWIRGLGGQQLDLRLGEVLPSAQAVLGRIPGIVTTTFGALASALVVVIIGLYTAAHPAAYVDGLTRLFPIERRERVRGLLGEIGHVLRRWLVGQLVSMAAVGVLSYLGLLLLGMPLAVGLAVLTGLLEFVPYVGPIAAAVPAVLVGLTEGPAMALYVLLLYVGVQTAESYLITPLVQERAIYRPPAAIVVFQVLMGVLFGLLGVLLATPLAAVALVVVRRLYVEDALGDDVGRGG